MMKSFSKWAGDTHYANMDELTKQVDDGHQERVATIKEHTPFAAVQSVDKAALNRGTAALQGGAKTKLKTFAAMGDDANVAGASNSRRRATLLLTLKTLGYEDRKTLLTDVRSIADELGIAGPEQVDDAEGGGGDTQANAVQPLSADGNGLSGNIAGTPIGS